MTLRGMLNRVFHVENYGTLLTAAAGGTALANRTIINQATGLAGAAGGGVVWLPGGTYPADAINLPAGVGLRGQGQTRTVLQSTGAVTMVEVNGDDAGVSDLTLDAATRAAGSTGIKARNRSGLTIERATAKNCERGLDGRGLQNSELLFSDFDACTHAVGLDGVEDESTRETKNIRMLGGTISAAVTTGLRLETDEFAVSNVKAVWTRFTQNLGEAVAIRGAPTIVGRITATLTASVGIPPCEMPRRRSRSTTARGTASSPTSTSPARWWSATARPGS